jgi:hypothetical protein
MSDETTQGAGFPPRSEYEGAPPRAEEAEALPVAAPAAEAGPRVFPQHYALLFGHVACVLGFLGVWERAEHFGTEVRGTAMISASVVGLYAVYGTIVGVLNILHGRLRGMLSAFFTGFLATLFAFQALQRTWRHETYRSFGTVQEDVGSFFGAARAWVGQFGPGALLTFAGGIIVLSVFVKAFLPRKQPASQPAPSRRRK